MNACVREDVVWLVIELQEAFSLTNTTRYRAK